MKKDLLEKELTFLRKEFNIESSDEKIIEAINIFGEKYFDIVESQRVAYALLFLKDGLEKYGYLKESFEKEDEEYYRACSECGKIFLDGYCIDGGSAYYCEDECLHKHYTEKEWEEMYEDGGESYWTEFFY